MGITISREMLRKFELQAEAKLRLTLIAELQDRGLSESEALDWVNNEMEELGLTPSDVLKAIEEEENKELEGE